MTAPADLRFLLRPRSIAVVGASPTAGSFGQRLLASIADGYGGAIHPINPRYQEIAGLPCHPRLDALPAPPDCVALAVSDDRVEAALEEAASCGVRAAVLFGRGYEPAAPGRPSRSERLGAIARAAGMAVCGNNCMGFVNVVDQLKVTANPPPVPKTVGHIGLVSHSGSTWSGLVGNLRDMHFNYAISAGQEIATGLADYFAFLLAQLETRVIACVMETVRQPERFLAVIEAADRQGVPVVVLKLGRSERGRALALAHSGALTGSDAVYRAVFERHNVIAVTSPDALSDTVELLACGRRPTAAGVGIVTDSGGERELIVDTAAETGCPITTLSAETAARLVQVLDPGMTPENPVDSYGDGRTLLEDCLSVIADDPGVGVVALATNLVHGRAYLHAAGAAIERMAAATEKPALVFGNLHASVSREEATRLRGLGIPVLMGTPTALTAIRNFIAWHHRARPAEAPAAPATAVAHWTPILAAATAPLDATSSLRLFGDFGGPVVQTAIVGSAAEARAAAARLGYPVVLKAAAAELLHKTDAGGVVLGLADDTALEAAYARLAEKFGASLALQKQAVGGVEMLLGMVNDAQFGPMMTVGLGGVFTEILEDVVTVQPPIAAATALALLSRLKGFALLRGARGRPAVDLPALAAAIEHFSLLCATVGRQLSAMDVNPLIATAQGCVAVDALAIPKEDKR